MMTVVVGETALSRIRVDSCGPKAVDSRMDRVADDDLGFDSSVMRLSNKLGTEVDVM
jgi:hypothetical protein